MNADVLEDLSRKNQRAVHLLCRPEGETSCSFVSFVVKP
jgi:hypothetical protein